MNNSTVVISEAIDQERRVTALIFAIFSSLGVLLNSTPLILTFTTNLRSNFVHIFVSNLSAADLLLSACFLFGNTFYVLYRELLPNLGCRWLGFLIFTTAYQEFMFPPLLSLNRYISLYHESMYKKIYTKRNMCVIIVSSWVLCAVMPMVFYWTNHTGYDTDNEHCCVTVVGDPVWTVIYWVLVIMPLIVFCDGTMLYCNTKMYRKLHQHGEGADLVKNNIMRRNRELMWFLWADLSLPICFHTVYHILKFIVVNRDGVGVRRFFAMLYLMNSCFRGTLTLSLLRPYRRKMRNILCFWKKNQIHPFGGSEADRNRRGTVGGTQAGGNSRVATVTGK